MSYRIDEIEGIGALMAGKLGEAGVRTTEDLLSRCGSDAGRKAISKQCGISETSLLAWVNMADLMRITGVAGEFSELLEAAGVDTVKELQHRNVDNLVTKMAAVNEEKKLVRRLPNASEVTKWIEQAKTLAPMVSH